MEEAFIGAVHNKNKIKLTFYSKDDGGILARVCAPMDYGPSRRAYDKSNRYHLWDYESDERQHVLSLSPRQIIAMDVLDELFEPAEFVTWDLKKSPWFIKRDWGNYS